ncbi:hypothetical protein BLOT_002854 [Blomia tropicalis]|nr:hypothetical protein BLOT_002854 [Blomia tropicalis]
MNKSAPATADLNLLLFNLALVAVPAEVLSSFRLSYPECGTDPKELLAHLKQTVKILTAIQVAFITFKEKFSFAYYNANGTYPKYKENPYRLQSYLSNCIKKNKLPFTKHQYYSLSLWDDYEFDKNFKPDDAFNINSVLADKAISPDKTVLIEHLMKKLPIPNNEKRLILKWLETNFTNASEFLENVDKNGIKEEDLIIGVSPKERELKNEPRLFAVMSIFLRIYFVLTEHMLAHDILPFFPQITMTNSLTQLQKRICNIMNDMSNQSDNSSIVIFNIDFEKWNLNMRGELVDPVFKCLDDLYGYKRVFQLTHYIFSHSTIYNTSNIYHLPYSNNDLIDCPAVWHDHQGGFEGARQKGWTLHTVCLLELVTKGRFSSFSLLGQGDNQVIVAKINRPSNDYVMIRDLIQEFRQKLGEMLEKAGLPLKAGETWCSGFLFMYGKEINDIYNLF